MALKIAKSEIRIDPALDRSDSGARGDRKVLVTELWPQGERLVDDVDWHPPTRGGVASVLKVDGLEFAFFTEAAAQDRHHHKMSFEIYTILEGQCVIEVEGHHHQLAEGDSLIVSPGECHEVLAGADSFLAQVVATPCHGASDKYLCRK